MTAIPNNIDETAALLASADYLAGRELATVAFLSGAEARPPAVP